MNEHNCQKSTILGALRNCLLSKPFTCYRHNPLTLRSKCTHFEKKMTFASSLQTRLCENKKNLNTTGPQTVKAIIHFRNRKQKFTDL